MPKEGLEPSCLATHAPETCVSTNFTTSAAQVVPSFKDQVSGKLNLLKLETFVLETDCAQDWTRTSTPVKALPPQSSVSTNFTTWAELLCVSVFDFEIKGDKSKKLWRFYKNTFFKVSHYGGIL